MGLEPTCACAVSGTMIYLLATATGAMFSTMVWLTVFRMREDRVRQVRALTRGKFAFRPKERARFVLNRSFRVPEERREWEEELVARLATVPVEAEPVRSPAPRA